MRTSSRRGAGTGSGPFSGNGMQSDPRRTQERRNHEIERRRSERLPMDLPIHWDFFSLQDGVRAGRLLDFSPTGCKIAAVEPIELRRWIRLVIPVPESVVRLWCVGRSIWAAEDSSGTHAYGIEFVRPLDAAWIDVLRTHSASTAGMPSPHEEPRQLLDLGPELDGCPRVHASLYSSLLNGNFLR